MLQLQEMPQASSQRCHAVVTEVGAHHPQLQVCELQHAWDQGWVHTVDFVELQVLECCQ
jgi:hypothetical protein